MPVKVPTSLPAIKYLEQENIFVMDENRASMQEIRPLKIAILNLMPNKEDTEVQLIRLIANTPLQVEVVLLKTETYCSKNTAEDYLNSFYYTFNEKKNEKFDGLIITGAPVEKMDFQDVVYWDELQNIMKWAEHNVYSTMYICWAAQAAMFYHYDINKIMLNKKISGIFTHTTYNKTNPLLRGFNDEFNAPHSRYTEVEAEKVRANPDLDILAESSEAGLYLVSSRDLRRVFVFGHGEYDVDTLDKEYKRDKEKGLNIQPPKHYYVGNDEKLPKMSWRAHESMLIANWLNYCVYQSTPYDIESIN